MKITKFKEAQRDLDRVHDQIYRLSNRKVISEADRMKQYDYLKARLSFALNVKNKEKVLRKFGVYYGS